MKMFEYLLLACLFSHLICQYFRKYLLIMLIVLVSPEDKNEWIKKLSLLETNKPTKFLKEHILNTKNFILGKKSLSIINISKLL